MAQMTQEGRNRPAAYGCGLPHSSPTTSRGASVNVIGPLRGGFQRGLITRLRLSKEPEGQKVGQEAWSGGEAGRGARERFWGECGGEELKRPRAGFSAREVGSGPQEGLSLSLSRRRKASPSLDHLSAVLSSRGLLC